MKKVKRWLVSLIALLLFVMPVVAMSTPVSKSEACELLKRAALRHHFATASSPPGHYYCDFDSSSGGYFVVSLHYSYKAPVGTFGSNLIGWYAVRRIDGKIFEWDVANMRLGHPVSDD